MAATATLKTLEKTQKQFLVTGTVTLSGSYVTGGDTLDLSTLDLPVLTSAVPSFVQFNAAAGFLFTFVPGSTLANGKIEMYENAAGAGAFAQVAAGAYPATPTVNFLALIPSL